MYATFQHPRSAYRCHTPHQKILSPRVNVAENNTSVFLSVFLPGVQKDEIVITIKDGRTLVVSGKKKRPDYAENHRFIHKERKFGEFTREFSLSNNLDIQSITAQFENGVLQITLAKIPEKTVTVEIQ